MSKKIRRDEDTARDAKIYTYLLHISGIKNNPQNININELEAKIAKRWNDAANRTFIRRVINNLYPDRMERFGGIIVPSPPLLHPVFNMTSVHKVNEQINHEEIVCNNSNMVINIDSFLIKIHCSSTGKVVDLFGQHSSSYFFSFGMLKLCDDYSNASDDEIIERIKEANKFFVCCWAIAEGGAYLNEKNNTIERNFKKLPSDNYGVSTIRGLYLHRISEIADLGKVFTVVCKCIISKFQSLDNQN